MKGSDSIVNVFVRFLSQYGQYSGTSAVLSQFTECLDADEVLGVQFLRAKRVPLTFQDPETAMISVLRTGLDLTALFNNMWTLKFKAQPVLDPSAYAAFFA